MLHREKNPLLLLLLVFILSGLLVAFRVERGTWHTGGGVKVTRLTPCSRQQVLRLLLKPDALEIWSTGMIYVAPNTRYNPPNYPSTATRRKPLFTGADLDLKKLSMGQDPITGYYFINFSMKNAAASKLTSFTAHHIGSYITITLEGIVVSSLILHYALPGKGRFQMSPRSPALGSAKCANG